jgi:hypothetical protein
MITEPVVIPGPRAPVRIDDGTCWALFAYDIGMAIDLDEAQRLILSQAERDEIKHQRPSPVYLQFRPAPLRVNEDSEPIALGKGGSLRTEPQLELTLYDFGAVSVAYRVPIEGTLEELLPVAEALYQNATLLADSRRRVERLLQELGPAVRNANFTDFVEDYLVYHARKWTAPGQITAALLAEQRAVAAVLRAERDPLSDEEINDAMCRHIAYTQNDCTLIDWNTAMVFEQRADDALAILEFANVELLEMRFLDDRLDGILDRTYAGLHRRKPTQRLRLASSAEERRRLAAMQIDSALLFEGINNAIKLVGDQYLARLYRIAAERLHLPEWDASILRKLGTLEDLYEKLVDEAASRRMEVLEWIIIVLIAVSIVIPFVVGGGGH